MFGLPLSRSAIFTNSPNTRLFRTTALYALAGSILAAATAVVDLLVLDNNRAAGMFSNPIHFAGAAALCGALGLIGFFAVPKLWRFVLLVGPLAACFAVLASQSRGPFAVFLLLLPIATLLMSRRLVPVLLIGLLGTAALMTLHWLQPTLLARSFDLARNLIEGEALDRSSEIRLLLLEAAWQAFLERPWFGHGWNNLIAATAPFLPEELREFALANFNHLHNDLGDFMVGGGIAGIFIYLAILSAPIGIALALPRGPGYWTRIVAALVLVLAYGGMGLTNMMFGQEFHTALYTVIAAAILASDAPSGTPPRGGDTESAETSADKVLISGE